jgi:hypothetical protein
MIDDLQPADSEDGLTSPLISGEESQKATTVLDTGMAQKGGRAEDLRMGRMR